MTVSQDQRSPHPDPLPFFRYPARRVIMDDTRRPVRGLLWPLLLTSLLVVGCASAPVHTEGVTGPVAWHATEFQLAKTTIQGQPSEWYAFTLVRLANACQSHEKSP
jgi:hypothetical protein